MARPQVEDGGDAMQIWSISDSRHEVVLQIKDGKQKTSHRKHLKKIKLSL
jgi:hypothetical protein